MKINNIILCENIFLIIITHINNKTTTINYLHNDTIAITYKSLLYLKQFYRNTITNLRFYLFVIFFLQMHCAYFTLRSVGRHELKFYYIQKKLEFTTPSTILGQGLLVPPPSIRPCPLYFSTYFKSIEKVCQVYNLRNNHIRIPIHFAEKFFFRSSSCFRVRQ